jgi:predicted DNA-binding transcriptional regulator AlpA
MTEEEVMRSTGLGASTIKKLEAMKVFPPRDEEGKWRGDDIIEWEKSRVAISNSGWGKGIRLNIKSARRD